MQQAASPLSCASTLLRNRPNTSVPKATPLATAKKMPARSRDGADVAGQVEVYLWSNGWSRLTDVACNQARLQWHLADLQHSTYDHEGFGQAKPIKDVWCW
jgi:hypothetical protein